MKTLKAWAAAAAMVALTGAAQAALVSLGNGTVKDTNTNLIWLQDWNVNGSADWGTQKAWAEGLDFAGSTDWELPEISEYAALFTAYGNLTAVTNFTNVQSFAYWSGTELTAGSVSWVFFPVSNLQAGLNQGGQYFAVAVRPGDVTVSVPEPQTLALALLALGATVVARRRRSR
jgi:hypothetical protein